MSGRALEDPVAVAPAWAIRLYPSIAGAPVIDRGSDLDAWRAPVACHRVGLHDRAPLRLLLVGENQAVAAADSFGRVHGIPNLRHGDASLLPSAPSVSPQGSIMAFVRRNALAFLR